MASFHKSTHLELNVGPGLKITAFHPKTTFTTFRNGLEHPDSPASVGIENAATSFVQSKLSISSDDIVYNMSGYTTGSTTHAYLKQYYNGVPFANAVANVAWKDSKVVAFGSSFVEKSPNVLIAHPKQTIDVKAIIPQAEQTLNGTYNGHPPTVEYLVKPDGSISLVHVVQIQNDELGTWYEAFVDAHSGDILSVTDFVCQISYTLIPITKQAPQDGLENLKDPLDTIASPSGWHSLATAGNNAVVYKGKLIPESSTALNTNYPFDESEDPTRLNNLNAACVDAFYLINTFHDFTYRYGFTEAAYNFQSDNFGKGGKGGDRVIVSIRDSGEVNSANFATPPDGQSGICRMSIQTKAEPHRDGALVNSLVIHELTHGITNRMIGGGDSRPLQTLESRGLGEGWSDAMANWTAKTSAGVPDFIMSVPVNDKEPKKNLRQYSTDPSVNPLKYSDVKNFQEEHEIGAIWANILHNVYAALVKEHGFSSTAMTNPDGSEGNIVFLHHFIDSLALLHTNPTFVSARDAWIQADVNRYGGVNKSLLWNVFASRGLGVGAANYVDSFDVPEEGKDD